MLGRASLVERGSDRLAERRRTRRRYRLIALILLVVVLFGAAIYGLHQKSVRISNLYFLSSENSLSTYVYHAMWGSYFGIIPRDSIFFFPANQIRENILEANLDIAAVSISRSGLNGLTINVDKRVPIARWCGVTPLSDDAYKSCYIFDASGFIFARAVTSTYTINRFSLYSPLVGEVSEPLQATVAYSDTLPAVFNFARELSTLGSPTVSVSIHDGEIDNILTSGTRITHVLGHEKNAFTALVSSRDNFNLADGSVDYVDLRFDGKVYLKKK